MLTNLVFYFEGTVLVINSGHDLRILLQPEENINFDYFILLRLFNKQFEITFANGRIAALSASRFIIDEPAAKHSAPNHNCPARLSCKTYQRIRKKNETLEIGICGK